MSGNRQSSHISWAMRFPFLTLNKLLEWLKPGLPALWSSPPCWSAFLLTGRSSCWPPSCQQLFDRLMMQVQYGVTTPPLPPPFINQWHQALLLLTIWLPPQSEQTIFENLSVGLSLWMSVTGDLFEIFTISLVRTCNRIGDSHPVVSDTS